MSFVSTGSAGPHPLPDKLRACPTPFLVYHEEQALEDAARLQSGLLGQLPRSELFYSVKTNPLLPLLKALGAGGWGLEVVGRENLRSAISSGVPPERLLWSGPGWKKEELEAAILGAGIRRITIDSLDMAELLGALCRSGSAVRGLDVALRLHDGESHFGFARKPELLREAFARIPPPSLSRCGLHLHRNAHGSPRDIGEQCADFRARAGILRDTIPMAGRRIDFLDIGGGIDSPHVYRPHPQELGRFHNPGETQALREGRLAPRFSLLEAATEIGRAVAGELGPEWKELPVLFEPGRAVCARSLSAVIGVIAAKRGFYPGAQLLICDANTAQLGPLHRGVFPVKTNSIGNIPSFVYGNLPHASDWLFQAIPLPELRAGERIEILHTGAYFLPLEASFGQGLPAIYCGRTGSPLRAGTPLS